MYESPITKIYGEIENEIIKQDEEHLMYSVNQTVGYRVDKDELLKALRYDRQQYARGYNDGTKEVLQRVELAIKQGKWIEERDDYGNITGWHCSNCYNKTGFVTTCAWDYCPACGAEMESEE